MKLRKGRFAAIVLLLPLLLTGCGGGGDDGNGGSSEPTCSDGQHYDSTLGKCVDDAKAPSSAKAVWISPTATCSVPEGVDFEGYFDKNGMLEYLDCIVPPIDTWIDKVYSDMSHPAGYLFIPTGLVVKSACTKPDKTQTANDMDAFYCPADQIVYIGEQATWTYYSQDGDASMAMAMSHEVGHHFEQMEGLFAALDEDGRTNADTIMTEDLADCVAGAYMNYVNRSGAYNVSDDSQDLADVIAAISSAEDDPNRDHGTLNERLNSFLASFGSTQEQPMFACNSIISGFSIIK
jgi:hypothetical protein